MNLKLKNKIEKNFKMFVNFETWGQFREKHGMAHRFKSFLWHTGIKSENISQYMAPTG